MPEFTEGQRARILDMPGTGKHLIDRFVTVWKIGPWSEPDDVVVTTADGFRFVVKAQQLAHVDTSPLTE